MPDSQAEMVGRRVIEEGWNLGRIETIRQLVSSDYVRSGTTVLEGATGPRLDPTQRSSVPDLHVSIEEVVAQDERGAIRTVITGTHSADQLGFAPTLRRFTVDSMVFIHVRDGVLALFVIETHPASCNSSSGWTYHGGHEGPVTFGTSC